MECVRSSNSKTNRILIDLWPQLTSHFALATSLLSCSLLFFSLHPPPPHHHHFLALDCMQLRSTGIGFQLVSRKQSKRLVVLGCGRRAFGAGADFVERSLHTKVGRDRLSAAAPKLHYFLYCAARDGGWKGDVDWPGHHARSLTPTVQYSWLWTEWY